MKNLIKTAIAASVLASSSAMALEFDYEASLVFNPAETTTNNGAAITTNTASQLVWGMGWPSPSTDPKSSLTIGDAVTDTMPDTVATGTTSGLVGVGNSLTHNNYPITSPFLTSGQLIDNLTLYAEGDLGNTPVYIADTLTLNFSFLETPNSGTCAGNTGLPNWDGQGAAAFESCPDLWAIDPVGSSSLAPQTFEYGGIDYLLEVVIFDENDNPLALADQALLPSECSALGLGTTCAGFRTGENLETTRIFGFQVTAVPVPAAVWLFGSALLGFAGYSRRKNKS